MLCMPMQKQDPLPEVMVCMFTTCTQYNVSIPSYPGKWGGCVAKQYHLYWLCRHTRWHHVETHTQASTAQTVCTSLQGILSGWGLSTRQSITSMAKTITPVHLTSDSSLANMRLVQTHFPPILVNTTRSMCLVWSMCVLELSVVMFCSQLYGDRRCGVRFASAGNKDLLWGGRAISLRYTSAGFFKAGGWRLAADGWLSV